MERSVRKLLAGSTPTLLSLVLLAAAVVAAITEPAAMTTLRNAAFDTYQRVKPREYRPIGVRVIDVDDESLERVGQWPWPRNVFADLIERLDGAGVSAIGLDIVFAEPDRTSPERALSAWLDDPDVRAVVSGLPDFDRELGEQIASAPVVTGFILTQPEGPGRHPAARGRFILAGDSPLEFLPVFGGSAASLPLLEDVAAGNGALNVIPGSDGVVRTVQLLARLDDTLYPSLAAEALRVADGAENYVVKSSGASGESRFGGRTGIVNVRIGSREIATDRKGGIWLHFTGPVGERTIPAWQMLDGTVSREALEGSVVIVGASASGLTDLRLNPLGRIAGGADVHAQAIEQILQETYLERPDWATAAEVLFMVSMWLALVVAIPRFGALPAAAMGLVATAAAYLGSWLAFDRLRLLLDPTFPSLTALSVYLICSISRHRRTERDRHWIQEAFSSYISPNLVRHLIENPGELGLGGERRECSFVMSDMESFTSLVERSEPARVVELLNEYLDGVVRIALEHEGTLDRIVGDAVAVMFSAPAVQPDHPRRAVACALDIDRFARAFRARKAEEGIEVGRTRIGVNTGWVTIGNVGGERIVDYRALGDAVNVTARLETVNRQLGTNVCVSGTTASACPGFRGRPAGTLVLKGKSEGLETFEPLTPGESDPEALAAYLEAFDLMKDERPSARDAFERLRERYPEDPLVAFHLARLTAGQTGAVVVLTEK